MLPPAFGSATHNLFRHGSIDQCAQYIAYAVFTARQRLHTLQQRAGVCTQCGVLLSMVTMPALASNHYSLASFATWILSPADTVYALALPFNDNYNEGFFVDKIRIIL